MDDPEFGSWDGQSIFLFSITSILVFKAKSTSYSVGTGILSWNNESDAWYFRLIFIVCWVKDEWIYASIFVHAWMAGTGTTLPLWSCHFCVVTQPCFPLVLDQRFGTVYSSHIQGPVRTSGTRMHRFFPSGPWRWNGYTVPKRLSRTEEKQRWVTTQKWQLHTATPAEASNHTALSLVWSEVSAGGASKHVL